MTRMQKQIAKNKSGDSSTDVGSKELSTMMTNLDSANQTMQSNQSEMDMKSNASVTDVQSFKTDTIDNNGLRYS